MAIRECPLSNISTGVAPAVTTFVTAALAIAQKQPPAGPDPAPLLCQALPARSSSVSALSRWTTTSDRAEPDEPLHRPGRSPVDAARRGRPSGVRPLREAQQ